jgi:hypothetical protein
MSSSKDVDAFVRVVVLRRGKVKPAELMLRDGEKGLSLFARSHAVRAGRILQAVRAAGKQGELGLTVISAADLIKMGLALVQTPGGTPSEIVNALHYEARLSWWRRVRLWLGRQSIVDYFNEHVSPRIQAASRPLLEEESR